MNNSNPLSSNQIRRRHGQSLRNLAITAVIGVCGAAGSAAANAQTTITDGEVFGRAPAGDSIAALSTTTGFQRQVAVNAKGRYTIGPLPVDIYTVMLEEDGHPVVEHLNVPVEADSGIRVDFDCSQGQCAQLANKP